MKIRFKKRQVYLNLFLGIIWSVNAIVQTVIKENPSWYDYIWYPLAGIYLILFYFQKKEKYLSIENGIIKKNRPFGDKMNMNDIIRIKDFAGEYMLTSEFQDMKINNNLIDERSQNDLKAELKKLNVEWT